MDYEDYHFGGNGYADARAEEAAERAANTLTIEDLYLQGTTEPFYLNEDEILLWIRDRGDGTALVRVRTFRIETTIDADIRPRTS